MAELAAPAVMVAAGASEEGEGVITANLVRSVAFIIADPVVVVVMAAVAVAVEQPKEVSAVVAALTTPGRISRTREVSVPETDRWLSPALALSVVTASLIPARLVMMVNRTGITTTAISPAQDWALVVVTISRKEGMANSVTTATPTIAMPVITTAQPTRETSVATAMLAVPSNAMTLIP